MLPFSNTLSRRTAAAVLAVAAATGSLLFASQTARADILSPTLNANDDDGVEYVGTTWTTTGEFFPGGGDIGVLYLDSGANPGWSFVLPSGLPANATITAAYVRVHTRDAGGGSATYKLVIENVDPATQTQWSGSHLPSDASPVINNANQSHSFGNETFYWGESDTNPINLASDVQQLLTTYGDMGAGDRINVYALHQSGGYAGFEDTVASNSSNHATLTITYTLASSPTHTTLVRPPNNLGLVGYWSFNEGTSTKATDFSGHGNHGTFSNIANPPTATSGWMNGKRSKALQFDGNNDSVSTADINATDGVSTMTIALWLKHDSAIQRTIISKVDSSLNGWFLQTHSNRYLEFFPDLAGGGGGSAFTANDTQVEGVWEHWVVVFDDAAATDVTFYKNGVLIPTATDNGTAAATHGNSEPVRIGELNIASGSGNYFNGALDDVRIYNRALSASEVATLARSGAVRINASSKTLAQGSSLERGLIGLWTFDGPDTTDKIYDRSGNNNHGYVINGATSSMKAIGKLGQAFRFDGLNDNIDTLPANNVPYGTAGTIAYWMKDEGSVLIAVPVAWSHTRYCSRTGVGGQFNMQCTGGTETVESTTDVFNDGRWHHIVYSMTPGNNVLYVDGVAEDSTGGSVDDANDDYGITIGTRPFAPEYYKGLLDDVRIYNRALTASEANQLYRLGSVILRP